MDCQHQLDTPQPRGCVRTTAIILSLPLNSFSFIPPGSKCFQPNRGSESDYFQLSSSLSLPSSSSLCGAVQPHVSTSNGDHLPPKVLATQSQAVRGCTQPHPLWAPQLPLPSSLAQPVYSSSGFDLLSILGRVATRPNPSITLGPVDMSCSFVVVDIRRYDSPIVYASPSFYRLTGYDAHEVLGRNCRFLQAPGGCVGKGERRHHTAPEAVAYMKKNLSDDKECQASLINYRKDGSSFINLVTIIPIAGGVSCSPEDQNDVVFHVGFQVDLTEQPNAILQKLRDGSFMVNYKSGFTLPNTPNPSIRDRRNHNYVLNAVSEELRDLLSNPSFLSSISAPTSDADHVECQEGNNPLSLLLLGAMPDFVLVLSLKGSFLYVAPSITRVLEYSPEEMAGKSVVDYCHPSDIVPLMRELKESSTILCPQEGHRFGSTLMNTPKTVNLLFRARTKRETYIWIECTGRLHVEPGKGRKAIILSARPRTMPRFDWTNAPDVRWQGQASERGDIAREVWGLLSIGGTVLFMSANVKNVLGWGVGEIIGMSLNEFVVESSANSLGVALHRVAQGNNGRTETVECRVRQKTGEYTRLSIVLYPLPAGADSQSELRRLPIVCQISPISATPTIDRQLVTSISRGNVFSEQDAAQEGSWQFELQQLKIENQKLAAEVEFLEGSIGLQNHEHQPTNPTMASSSTHNPAEWTPQHNPLKRR